MIATDAVAVGGLHPASAPQRARTPGRAIIWFLFPAAFLLVVVLVVPLCATVWLSLFQHVDAHGLAIPRSLEHVVCGGSAMPRAMMGTSWAQWGSTK